MGGSRAQSLLMYQTKGKDVAEAETFLNKIKTEFDTSMDNKTSQAVKYSRQQHSKVFFMLLNSWHLYSFDM